MIAIGWNKGAVKDFPLKGYLDEISIHNISIDQSRATQMYNNGVPIDLGSDSSIISWWRMGDSDEFPNLIDRGPNDNTIVLYNMTSGSIVSDVP